MFDSIGNGISNMINTVLTFFKMNWGWFVAGIFVLIILCCVVIWIKDRFDEFQIARYEKNRTPEERKLEIIAKNVCDKTGRVEYVFVTKRSIRILVKSRSGKNKWDCWLDFDDHGKLTGNYRIICQNDDSEKPKEVAEAIKEEIVSKML